MTLQSEIEIFLTKDYKQEKIQVFQAQKLAFFYFFAEQSEIERL